MSATGLEVFDKTLQTTNIWLDEIMADHGPDRRVAWHMLGAVLRTLRDWLQIELAANLGRNCRFSCAEPTMIGIGRVICRRAAVRWRIFCSGWPRR